MKYCFVKISSRAELQSMFSFRILNPLKMKDAGLAQVELYCEEDDWSNGISSCNY